MSTLEEGRASKRQKTDEDNMAEADKREVCEDPHNPSPSQVVHVRGLSDTITERDLIDALQSFGTISYIMVLTRKRQALVEFEDISGAMSLVKYAQSNPVYVGHKQAHFNYSTSQKIQRPVPGEEKINNVLLLTVLNPRYTITVDVLHTICNRYGTVNRIVIFKKNGVQAMVEFENTDAAVQAKQSLNGADIYSGCCTLRIEYAKPTKLNVFTNNSESWDYTIAPAGNTIGVDSQTSGKGQPLLAEPRYGSAPIVYDAHSDSGECFDACTSERYPLLLHESLPYPDPNQLNSRGMYQQGCVLMAYGLNNTKMNAHKLFNLFCLYGNVVRIKFLRSKEGSAMIQMSDMLSCERVIKNLNNCYIFGSKLQLGFSKQAYLQDLPSPYQLSDGSLSFVDFMSNKNNRFTNQESAAKNRIQAPSRCLYYWNCPCDITEQQLCDIISSTGAKLPTKIRQFPAKNDKSSTGLLEWSNKSDAIEALCCANHTEIPNPAGKYPYIFKLCFSSQPIM